MDIKVYTFLTLLCSSFICRKEVCLVEDVYTHKRWSGDEEAFLAYVSENDAVNITLTYEYLDEADFFSTFSFSPSTKLSKRIETRYGEETFYNLETLKKANDWMDFKILSETGSLEVFYDEANTHKMFSLNQTSNKIKNLIITAQKISFCQNARKWVYQKPGKAILETKSVSNIYLTTPPTEDHTINVTTEEGVIEVMALDSPDVPPEITIQLTIKGKLIELSLAEVKINSSQLSTGKHEIGFRTKDHTLQVNLDGKKLDVTTFDDTNTYNTPYNLKQIVIKNTRAMRLFKQHSKERKWVLSEGKHQIIPLGKETIYKSFHFKFYSDDINLKPTISILNFNITLTSSEYILNIESTKFTLKSIEDSVQKTEFYENKSITTVVIFSKLGSFNVSLSVSNKTTPTTKPTTSDPVDNCEDCLPYQISLILSICLVVWLSYCIGIRRCKEGFNSMSAKFRQKHSSNNVDQSPGRDANENGRIPEEQQHFNLQHIT